MGILRKFFIGFLFFVLGAFFVLVLAYICISFFLPDVSNLQNFEFYQSSYIYDRDGNLLYTVHGDENREYVSYNKISSNLVNATVAIEDDQFFNHMGFDLGGLYQAMRYEFFNSGVKRGGSTITQQLAKNSFLTSEKTYIRKVKEIVLALNIEFNYTKEKILELYLNKIPYGNNTFGCDTAAKLYFNQDVRFLDLAESVVLAALPQAPSRYNPYGDNRYSHLLREFTLDEIENRGIQSVADLRLSEYSSGLIGDWVFLSEDMKIYIPGRTDFILNRMYELDIITLFERNDALEKLANIEFVNLSSPIKYPHFVFYVLEEIEKNYGEDFVKSGGLKIYTTIDPLIQDHLEDLASQKKSYNKLKFGADNMATLVADTFTGEILGMLGSVDYYDESIDGQVNVVLRPRQPGSSFKPFIYAKAFLDGYSPSHIISDSKLKIGNNYPQNYDGKFRGKLTMREALAQSRNIPAIKTYYLAGEQTALLPFLNKLGFKSLDVEYDYGYPLALGAGEVTMMEMAQAFGIFSNGGKLKEYTGISRIEDSNGHLIYEYDVEDGEDVLDSDIAYLITNVLSDAKARIGKNLAVSGYDVATKTGTSTKKTKNKNGWVRPGDLWTTGYSPGIVVSVWIGNTKGDGLFYAANGYDVAAPIFSNVMKFVLDSREKEKFEIPDGIVFEWIKKGAGRFAARSEVFARDYFLPSSQNFYQEIEKTFFWPKFIKISN